jgi:hypothetical protein
MLRDLCQARSSVHWLPRLAAALPFLVASFFCGRAASRTARITARELAIILQVRGWSETQLTAI